MQIKIQRIKNETTPRPLLSSSPTLLDEYRIHSLSRIASLACEYQSKDPPPNRLHDVVVFVALNCDDGERSPAASDTHSLPPIR